jgi:hypothetical protein
MQPKFAIRTLFAFLATAVLALPVSAFPASAAAAPAQVDDAVAQRLQSTPESALIPVIVEGRRGRR